MSLFQESIIRKHLGYLDQELVDQAYLRFKKVYSANKISNIKTANEEQYQEGFIKDIFGEVLGYSVFPDQPFNIQTEKKNEANSKKADGAIFQGENVVGVIELKDNKTKNLDAVKDQAFGYKNNHKECSYVISSNFHKLRLYIDDATDYEEFDLYNLDKDSFKRFYLYLHKECLLDKNIPKLLKSETKFHEENITKSLYKDYSSFKNSFFQNVVKNNPQYDKLLLFKKSQKFLDKVLFVLFAEDKGLVSTNSIVQIVEKWNNLKSDAFDTPKPLYQLIALFFNNLFIGKKDQKGGVLIPEFGGEIFAPDEVLDTLMVDDEVLQDDLLKLSKYDFNTDVDVNILGHIFEHSLSEIEEVEASLKGEVADKTKGKRKKDGVFYTPKYITKYIVENTIGKLCAEKKTELELDRDIAIFEYQKADGKLNAKGIELYTTLNQYKDWLLTLKILDPACGSGAFLNQAVNYLVQEHAFVDDIIADLTNSPLRLYDTDIAILENNIYGVDINEESIEIAKLSLWLRTARKGRKLSNLSNNIKCGNSLIDDPAIAGDKAFNWHKEFPEVFANGGFDVVIGNPPYVQLQSLGAMSDNLKSCGYETYDKGGDLYCLFSERGYTLLRNNGLLSFIMPNKWMLVAYGKPLRKFLSKTGLQQVLNFGDVQFFQDAATIVCIFVTQKKAVQSVVKVLSLNQRSYNGDFLTAIANGIYDYPVSNFTENEWSIQPYAVAIKLQKMRENGIELKRLPIEINYGIKTGFNEAFYIDEPTRERLIAEDPRSAEIIHKMIRGRDIISYGYSGFEYLINTHNGVNSKIDPIQPIDVNQFPAIKKHLDQYYEYLAKRADKGKTPYNLRNCAYLDAFAQPKIIYPNMTSVFPFMYDESGLFANQKCFILTSSDKGFSILSLIAVFNSSLTKLWIWYNCPELLGGTREISKVYFENFPVPKMSSEDQKILGDLAKKQIELINSFQTEKRKFIKTIQRNYDLDKVSGKLEAWYELDFKSFNNELKKVKCKMSLSQENEWAVFFDNEKSKINILKAHINQTDKEIDQMVYALYELTEEEIKIVEAS